jgi:hypothetical protein
LKNLFLLAVLLLAPVVAHALPPINSCNYCSLPFPTSCWDGSKPKCQCSPADGSPGQYCCFKTCPARPPVIRRETWYPAFKVVSLSYAPAGKQSNVSYGSGSTMGSSQSTSFTTSTGVSYGGTLAFAVGVSVDQSFTFTTASTHTERIQKADNVTLGLNNGTGATDRPDHGYDTFWLWVNPKVDLVYRDEKFDRQEWSTSDGGPPIVMPLTVRQIQGIDSIPSYKLDMANVPYFTENDKAKLLALDPFLDPNYQPDPKRYMKVTTQMIWGPDNAADPVPSINVGWNYTTGQDNGFTTGEQERTAITVQTGFDLFGLIKAQAKVGGSFGVGFSQGSTTSSGYSETASVMLRSNTVCHAMMVDVYFDRDFNTFSAVPVREYSCTQRSVAVAAPPAGSQKQTGPQIVKYRTSDGTLVETYTDAQGNYPVY